MLMTDDKKQMLIEYVKYFFRIFQHLTLTKLHYHSPRRSVGQNELKGIFGKEGKFVYCEISY